MSGGLSSYSCCPYCGQEMMTGGCACPGWLNRFRFATTSVGDNPCAARDAELARLRAELKSARFWERAWKAEAKSWRATAKDSNATTVNLRAELADRDKRLADLKRPTHGPCCTCQRCGKDYDSCRCELDEVVAELAAERERTARYNEMSGRDADELAAERAKYAEASTALDLCISERDRYADDAARLAAEIDDARSEVRNALSFLRHVWSLVMGDIPGPPPFDVALRDIEEKLSDEREALEKERKNGLAMVCIILSGSIDRTAKEAERLLAAQRRKGAAWALRETVDEWERAALAGCNPGSIIAYMRGRADEIESGEVEVPE